MNKFLNWMSHYFNFSNNDKVNSIEANRKEAYKLSSYTDKSFKEFNDAIDKLIKGEKCFIDFDEEFYLHEWKDVFEAVANGAYECGYIHFCISGQFDLNRTWSNTLLKKKFGLKSKIGDGLFKPTNLNGFKKYQPDLSNLAETNSRLVIIIPYLQDLLFFAGYKSFFDDMTTIYNLFDNIDIIVTQDNYNPDLVEYGKYNISIRSLKEIQGINSKPTLIISFDYETFHIAKDIFNDLERTIYYCQDIEAGFNALGSLYVRASQAIYQAKNLVLSTEILKTYLHEHKLISAGSIYVTAPVINSFEVNEQKNKKLFFYFRPEIFNSRNLSQHIMEAVETFCSENSGYDIYLMGTVDTCYSYVLNDNNIMIISKLQKEQYLEVISLCDLVVSLIYSAHPGVIAFQSAASGLPTITNIFENRSSEDLQKISDNLIPYDPIREKLIDKIYLALQRQKGKKSFNESLYAGTNNGSFTNFVRCIIEKN